MLCDKVSNPNIVVAWECLESCENEEKFKARLCTIVTHLGKPSPGTLTFLAYPETDAHEKKVIMPTKCSNLNMPKPSEAPLKSLVQCSSQLD